MKKKEVISTIAFEGIPPDLELQPNKVFQELLDCHLGDTGVVMYENTLGNHLLKNAKTIKLVLEDALPNKHDDEEVTPQDFDTLETALQTFYQQAISSLLILPGIDLAPTIEMERDAKVATVRELKARGSKPQ